MVFPRVFTSKRKSKNSNSRKLIPITLPKRKNEKFINLEAQNSNCSLTRLNSFTITNHSSQCTSPNKPFSRRVWGEKLREFALPTLSSIKWFMTAAIPAHSLRTWILVFTIWRCCHIIFLNLRMIWLWFLKVDLNVGTWEESSKCTNIINIYNK